MGLYKAQKTFRWWLLIEDFHLKKKIKTNKLNFTIVLYSRWRGIGAAWKRRGENGFLRTCLQSHDLRGVGFPTRVSLRCCSSRCPPAGRAGRSLPKRLQSVNCDNSWKPEFVTGASSSLLHLLSPRKVVIKSTYRLAFQGAVPSGSKIVLDFHLKMDFFFKLIRQEGKTKV